MNTYQKSIGLTIITILSFVIISCNNNEITSIPSVKRLPTPLGDSWLDFPQEEMDETCFQLMCQQRTELSEIPRFISEEALDSTIDVLNEMTEEEFCEWYHSQNNHNITLASHAYYDSLLIETSVEVGIDLNNMNENDNFDDNLTLLSESFIDNLENGNPSLYTTLMTTSGKTIYHPIGNIDMSALTDNLGQIIIGYEYYRYIGNYLLAMPLTVYMEIPFFTPSYESVAESIRAFMGNLGLSEEDGDFGLTRIPQQSSTIVDSNVPQNQSVNYNATLSINPDQSEYRFIVYSQDEQYGSLVRLYAYEYHGWFHNRRDGLCYVENYYFSPNTAKGVSTKRVLVSIDAYFNTVGTIDSHRSWPFHFTDQRKYKKRTYKDRLRFFKTTPLEPSLTISDVQISLSWGNTATVVLEY